MAVNDNVILYLHFSSAGKALCKSSVIFCAIDKTNNDYLFLCPNTPAEKQAEIKVLYQVLSIYLDKLKKNTN